MNTCLKEGKKLAEEINLFTANFCKNTIPKVILGVPHTHISLIANNVDFTKISVAAQNCSSEESGAYTGEVSASMIKSAGAAYVIIGHSERRTIFNEDDNVIEKKVQIALKHSLIPIFCCGEVKEEREKNLHFDVIEKQVKNALFGLDEFNISRIIIAYEPVWAIGTGLTAKPEQAQEIHEFIRKIIAKRFNENIANSIPVIYGGSVKPDNAKNIFEQADIDGGLIGGASLKSADFNAIIKDSIT